MADILLSKLLKLVKSYKAKPFLQRLCEEVFDSHLALKFSLVKRGTYWNDPDIYVVRCLVCEYQQMMDVHKAKEFLKKSLKNENPDIKKYGLKD